MNVIIIGSGKTIYFLARQFLSKGYHLTIITSNAREAQTLSRTIRSTIILGDGSDPAVLAEAGARRTDMLLALTPQDQDNLVACQLAQQMYGVPRTLALVNDPENEEIFHHLGVSVAFSATRIITSLIEEQTGFEMIKSLIPVAAGRLHLTEIIVRPDAPAVDKTLHELDLPEEALIAAIIRREEVLVPRGTSRLQNGDRLLLMVHPEQYGQALRTLTGEGA